MAYSRTITLTGPASAGATCKVALDTRAIVQAGKCRADRKDLRVLYNGTEIPRTFTHTDEIVFKAQATIAGAATDAGYQVVYGTGDATTPSENVWAASYDGSSLGALTVSGTATTRTIPRIRFLKHGTTALIRRQAEPAPDYFNVRDFGALYFDGTYWRVSYDGNDEGLDGQQGWEVYQRRSTDLRTWEYVGKTLSNGGGPVGSTDTGSASNMFIQTFPQYPGKFFGHHLGTPNLSSGDIPAMPYQAHLAVADAFEGPYTKRGPQIPFGGPGSIDELATYINSVQYNPALGKWMAFYSTTTSDWKRGIALALKSDLDNNSEPWVKQGLVIADTEQVENPIVFQASDGRWWMFCNHVGYKTVEYTVSDVAYWTDDPTAWNIDNKTSIIWPTFGAFDADAIGNISHPVIRNGVLYAAYDGVNNDSHEGRDGHIAEAVWPPVDASAVVLSSGAYLTTPATLSQGRVRVRFRPTGTDEIRVGCGTSPTSSTRVGFNVAAGADTLYTDCVGTLTNKQFQRIRKQTKTYEIERTATQDKVYMDGRLLATTGTIGGSLPLYVMGAGVIESIEFETSPVTTAAVGAESTVAIATPIGAAADTGQGSDSASVEVIPAPTPLAFDLSGAITELALLFDLGGFVMKAHKPPLSAVDSLGDTFAILSADRPTTATMDGS